MPGIRFVMETNLSKAVPLYDYVNDIYKSTKYHNHAIQPQHHAGSDLVLSLVDKSNKSKNVVLLSLSSIIYDKNVPTSKNKKTKLDFDQYAGEKGRAEIGLTKKFQKLQKKDIVV
ncbi:4743_t:CDS:2 [Rhizophagus irregularis]|nr:4743_t:CDS:2 [Rhizophagus irregularis]